MLPNTEIQQVLKYIYELSIGNKMKVIMLLENDAKLPGIYTTGGGKMVRISNDKIEIWSFPLLWHVMEMTDDAMIISQMRKAEEDARHFDDLMKGIS